MVKRKWDLFKISPFSITLVPYPNHLIQSLYWRWIKLQKILLAFIFQYHKILQILLETWTVTSSTISLVISWHHFCPPWPPISGLITRWSRTSDMELDIPSKSKSLRTQQIMINTTSPISQRTKLMIWIIVFKISLIILIYLSEKKNINDVMMILHSSVSVMFHLWLPMAPPTTHYRLLLDTELVSILPV